MGGNKHVITLSLKAFFADYRSQAKICINEDLKTICDLEVKISKIFQIRNFHLTCEAQLLPSCEDICLIKHGDLISVIPNDTKREVLILEEKYYMNTSVIEKHDKEKRKSLIDECPVKEKKRKKKNEEVCEENCNNQKPIAEQNGFDKKKKNHKTKMIFSQLINKTDNNHMFTSTPNDDENNTSSNHCYFPNKESVGIRVEPIEQNHRKPKNYGKVVEDVNSKINTEVFVEKCTKVLENKTKSNVVPEIINKELAEKAPYCDEEMDRPIEKKKKRIKPSHEENMEVDINFEDNHITRSGKRSLKRNFSDSNRIEQNEVSSQGSKIGNKLLQNVTINGQDNGKQKYYSLVCKGKKKSVSWSTSPLSKTINHVKIDKFPIEKLDVDFSKFVFKLSDAGIVPVPDEIPSESNVDNKETKHISLVRTDVNSTISSQWDKSSVPTKSSLSGCDRIEYSDPSFIPEKHKGTTSVLSRNICSKSQSNTEGFKSASQSFDVVDYDLNDSKKSKSSEIQEENEMEQKDSMKKEVVLKNWKESVSQQFAEEIANLQSQLVKGQTVEQNEKISSSPVSSKVVKLCNNSKLIKKRRTSRELNGVGYYMKLLSKIDFDVSKTISDVDVQEQVSNDREISNEKCEDLIKETECSNEASDTVETNSHSSMSTDSLIKRKRKRKHKKKMRPPTPIPLKYVENILSVQKIPRVMGKPKVHIRFENSTERLPCLNETSESSDKSNIRHDKIKIIQNISLEQKNEDEESISRYTNNVIEENLSTFDDLQDKIVPSVSSNLTHQCDASYTNTPDHYLNTKKENADKIEIPYGDICSNSIIDISTDVSRISDCSGGQVLNSNHDKESLEAAKRALLKTIDIDSFISKLSEERSIMSLNSKDDSFKNPGAASPSIEMLP